MEIRKTADGSETLFSHNFDETYHSINGAITESTYVFMDAGLRYSHAESVNILEIGFGTGLNAYLCYLESVKQKRPCLYTSLELYPVPEEIYIQLSCSESISHKEEFLLLHNSKWESAVEISPYFSLRKVKTDFSTYLFDSNCFDVVFYDAFSPVQQPELWTTEMFGKIYNSMKMEGILTTYCAKGQVRRNMQAAGFVVERLPGPPGKREMLRAIKNKDSILNTD